MNILVFNYEYPPIGGGGGVICKDISEELVNQGHKVSVITSLYKDLEIIENINGVEVFRVKVFNRKKQNVASLASMLSYLPSGIKKAGKLLEKNSFDIINTHFAIPTGPVGQHVASKFKIPNVLSIHGGDIYDPSKSLSPHKTPMLKQTVKSILNKADKVVAQSSDTRKNAIEFYNIKREIDIIPLGIKPNQFSKVSRASLDLPDNKFIFCTVGRLVRRKNIPELLEIFNNVKNTLPSKLLIIGDGPELSNLKETVSSLKLNNDVVFLGRVSDKQKFEYLSVSDVYLSTAMHEGFGIVFLEAMECGLPVICYDKGGQIDFLKNGTTGFLIKLGEKKIFQSSLIELLNNKKQMEEIGIFNKSYVKNFYINNIANQYLSLFNQVIQYKSFVQ